jgi:hypothetical protein
MFNFKRLEYRGCIIGAIFEAKATTASDAVTVTTMVHGNDVEVSSQWLIRTEPVQR